MFVPTKMSRNPFSDSRGVTEKSGGMAGNNNKGINSASCCMQIIQVCWQRQITEKNEPSGVANDPLKVRFLYVSLQWDVCIVVVVTLY